MSFAAYFKINEKLKNNIKFSKAENVVVVVVVVVDS